MKGRCPHGVPASAGGTIALPGVLKVPKVIVFYCASPPEGGTPNLHSSVIPLLAVISDGVFLPNSPDFRAAHLFEVFRRTAPRPFGP